MNPLTDVASKYTFLVVICSLQGVARSCRKLLQFKQHVTNIEPTCNDLLITVYLQWFTCDAIHLIEIIIASSHHRKAYENGEYRLKLAIGRSNCLR